MPRPPHRSSGFTLVEVLLVLGILTVLAGLSVPSVLRMFGQQKLTDSAERVRAGIASARIRAIESGVMYQFCCEMNGGSYVVVPSEPDHLNAPTGPASATVSMRSFGKLPAGISFKSAALGLGSAVAVAGGGNKLSQMSLEGLPNAGQLAALNWSPPILFNPDGAAGMDAEIVVGDAQANSVKLRVRAFTGAVSMERMTTVSR